MAGFPRALVTSILTPLAYLGLAPLALPAPASSPQNQAAPSALTLYVSRFLDVTNSAGEVGKTGHAFTAVEKFFGMPGDDGQITAFEDHRNFVYAEALIGHRSRGPVWSRRILFFKPSVFIVDDELISVGPDGLSPWRFQYAPYRAQIRGNKVTIRAGDRTILLETLHPLYVKHTLPDTARPVAEHDAAIEMTSLAKGRFISAIQVLDGNATGTQSRFHLVKMDGGMQLTAMTSERYFRWYRPSQHAGPGDIDIMNAAAKPLLRKRPLPSGILPHSAEGIRLLEIWDGDYRDGRHPKWDTGQPSADLVKAIDDGVIKPGRVIEFGSGTGTDAIYMASRGFDVTAIDISPSAVAQALEKGRKAGVKVRFLLADALNPPEIGQFDFIYDRACYHEVRGQNLEAYLETLRKVSRPGTRMLLLAGNSNGPDLGFGPPTVSEEDLRFDFTPLFDFEWLRESRFEVYPATAGFPLAWSALMRRK